MLLLKIKKNISPFLRLFQGCLFVIEFILLEFDNNCSSSKSVIHLKTKYKCIFVWVPYFPLMLR